MPAFRGKAAQFCLPHPIMNTTRQLYICVILFVVLFHLNTAVGSAILPVEDAELRALNTTRCDTACLLRFRCSPYYIDPVWTIVNGKCRVFVNGCIFATENCNRVNSCLKAMQATTKEKCQGACPNVCIEIYRPVCALFPYTNAKGVTGFNSTTFSNRCKLDTYACQNGAAYVGEPTVGECQAGLA